MDHVLFPYSRVGLIAILYIRTLSFVGIFLSQSTPDNSLHLFQTLDILSSTSLRQPPSSWIVVPKYLNLKHLGKLSITWLPYFFIQMFSWSPIAGKCSVFFWLIFNPAASFSLSRSLTSFQISLYYCRTGLDHRQITLPMGCPSASTSIIMINNSGLSADP